MDLKDSKGSKESEPAEQLYWCGLTGWDLVKFLRIPYENRNRERERNKRKAAPEESDKS